MMSMMLGQKAPTAAELLRPAAELPKTKEEAAEQYLDIVARFAAKGAKV